MSIKVKLNGLKLTSEIVLEDGTELLSWLCDRGLAPQEVEVRVAVGAPNRLHLDLDATTDFEIDGVTNEEMAAGLARQAKLLQEKAQELLMDTKVEDTE